MKTILLSQKKKTLVSDEDYVELSKYKWTYDNLYAQRSMKIDGKNKKIYMHRVVAGTPVGMQTDHINGNKLDNRRENLRVCTKAENMRNTTLRISNTSGYKGVSFNKRRRKFRAYIIHNSKQFELGFFATKVQAAKAYNSRAQELFGQFAYLNIIKDKD